MDEPSPFGSVRHSGPSRPVRAPSSTGAMSSWAVAASFVPCAERERRRPRLSSAAPRSEGSRVKRLRRRPKSFDIQVQDLTLHITASDDFAEESRAAALGFWEQLQSYGLRFPEFRQSKRPLTTVAADAPDIVKEMLGSAADAGVGPMFTFRGAVVDQVGRFLSDSMPEVTVACDGDYFLLGRKRLRLAVKRHGGAPITVAIEPDPHGVGVSTTLGRGRGGEGPDGLAVIAQTCMLADAA